jgi:menaquinone-dependent protoporphyrinogen oxidase
VKILVCCASRHGSTRELADKIASTLRRSAVPGGRALHVDVRDVHEAIDPSRYDAVIIGSAIYFGGWLRPARDFLAEHSDELRARPVWLFSSGPLDGQAQAPITATNAAEILRLSSAREHRLFGGRLSRSALTYAEKAVVRVVHASEGDFRNWADVERWATSIASALLSGNEVTPEVGPAVNS